MVSINFEIQGNLNNKVERLMKKWNLNKKETVRKIIKGFKEEKI